MKLMKTVVAFLLGLTALAIVAVLAFMPPKEPDQVIHRAGRDQDYAPKVGTHSFKDGALQYTYSLAFVELNDEGKFADKDQIDRLMADLRTKVNQTDTAILLYVHGWNHNASKSDNNVACFEELLRASAIMQSKYRATDQKTPREMYGVYVGWPGVVYRNDWINTLFTYFGRQAAADRIGERGSLLELFTRIRELRDQPRPQRTKFVIAAHSLGARMTYRALRPIMQHSIYLSGALRSSFIADLTIMINPALSADEHTALANLIDAQRQEPVDQTIPKFIIATSKTDEVLGGVFRWAQRLPSFFRGDYALTNRLRTTPIGLYDEYVTHLLKLDGNYQNTAGSNGCPTLNHNELEIIRGMERTRNPNELYEYKIINHYEANGKINYRTELIETSKSSHGPIMVVAVSGEIIPNHNDIFTSPFVDFLSRVLNAGLYRSR